jgi:hypothetical protein
LKYLIKRFNAINFLLLVEKVKILCVKAKTVGGAHVNNHMVGLWVVQWLLAIWLLLERQF